MDYNKSGMLNGVEWSIRHLDGRNFEVRLGDLTERFTTTYPMMFGMDVADVNEVNRLLDEMQYKFESKCQW